MGGIQRFSKKLGKAFLYGRAPSKASERLVISECRPKGNDLLPRDVMF